MAFRPALAGVRVLELEGIGPGPLGACVLADFGADVVTVCRTGDGGTVLSQNDPVSRGKRSIGLNLKSASGIAIFKRLAEKADVVIEPFRPGVMEKMGLGPDVLAELNPRLIYARMTGWGQGGVEKISKSAGHDANYLSLSGSLDLFRRWDESPSPPVNFAGDYAGGGMMLAMGVLVALHERSSSGLGQVIDVAMVDGANYVALPILKWMQVGFMPTLADGHMDTSKSILHQAPHWVGTYKCKDGQYVSVQAIEGPFYKLLLKLLGLGDVPGIPHQFDKASWGWMRARFASIFETKARDEWADIFLGTDACVAPILTVAEAARHPHSVARGSFAPTPGKEGLFEPMPAPKLSRTPGHAPRQEPVPGGDTRAVLGEAGISATEIDALVKAGAAGEAKASKL